MEDNSITIVSAYYDQPLIMKEWWRILREYWDEGLSPHVKLRLCDDHSNNHPLVVPGDIQDMFNVRAFRLKSDLPWQEMVCRNVCMKHVGGWAMLLDPDYMVPAGEMSKLVEMEKRRKNIYQPAQRIVKTHEPFGRSGNMFLIHSGDFWEAGGYDEQFAGGYGFSDAVFWQCVESIVKVRKHLLEDVFMDHYPMNGDISDAASPGVRDLTRNTPIFASVGAEMRAHGEAKYVQNRKSFDYEWERVV